MSTAPSTPLHSAYPSASEIDQWSHALLDRASATRFSTELQNPPWEGPPADRHSKGNRFVSFTLEDGHRFFGYWQPAAGPAPLLVHLPGYGAEMASHPQLVAAGFNVLHINPQGYCTPSGFDAEKKRTESNWPVLPDTVRTFGERGYTDWLRDAIVAVRWATSQPCVQPNRIAPFGTSQGGGTALLLASLLREQGVRCVAADLPFLTNFPMLADRTNRGAYGVAYDPLAQIAREQPDRLADAWRALGFIDTASHAHRLTFPTLLTSGGADTVCPPDTIAALFQRLPQTRCLNEMAGQGHEYTQPFLHLAMAWFRIYL